MLYEVIDHLVGFVLKQQVQLVENVFVLTLTLMVELWILCLSISHHHLCHCCCTALKMSIWRFWTHIMIAVVNWHFHTTRNFKQIFFWKVKRDLVMMVILYPSKELTKVVKHHYPYSVPEYSTLDTTITSKIMYPALSCELWMHIAQIWTLQILLS